MLGYIIIGFIAGAGTHYIYTDVQSKIAKNRRKRNRRRNQKRKQASTIFR